MQRNLIDTLNEEVKSNMIKLKREKTIYIHKKYKKKLLFTKQCYYEAEGKSLKLLSYRLQKQQAENAIHTIKKSEIRRDRNKTRKDPTEFCKVL